jgi:hypothetical protein
LLRFYRSGIDQQMDGEGSLQKRRTAELEGRCALMQQVLCRFRDGAVAQAIAALKVGSLEVTPLQGYFQEIIA